jgi:hypothetical protein
MRDIREHSARTGEPLRWFVYTLAATLPWLFLVLIGPIPTIVASCLGMGIWLWWLSPPVGLNRQPLTWLLTFLLLLASATTLLFAAYQL